MVTISQKEKFKLQNTNSQTVVKECLYLIYLYLTEINSRHSLMPTPFYIFLKINYNNHLIFGLMIPKTITYNVISKEFL